MARVLLCEERMLDIADWQMPLRYIAWLMSAVAVMAVGKRYAIVMLSQMKNLLSFQFFLFFNFLFLAFLLIHPTLCFLDYCYYHMKIWTDHEDFMKKM